ncbi:MAG: 50S ribosomal protein L6 [Candidatus Micrarchaeota archaeon]|nr:50S ribosomal protein L6 [Candidatus Micrarchaeota archaeon]
MRYISVDIPSGISASLEKNVISVKGPKGSVRKELKVHGVEVSLKDSKLEVDGKNIAVINTVKRQVLKMIEGCRDGFSSRMIIRYSHFPIKVSVKGNFFIIDNFGGEKLQRRAGIIGDTKVKISGQELTVEGPSRDDVSQTIANIRQHTKTKKKDSRVFQDGIYLIQ